MSKPYIRLDRDPWQPSCPKCQGPLGRPFYWGKHKGYRLLCASCHDVWLAKRQLAIEMNRQPEADEPDPRYA